MSKHEAEWPRDKKASLTLVLFAMKNIDPNFKRPLSNGENEPDESCNK